MGMRVSYQTMCCSFRQPEENRMLSWTSCAMAAPWVSPIATTFKQSLYLCSSMPPNSKVGALENPTNCVLDNPILLVLKAVEETL